MLLALPSAPAQDQGQPMFGKGRALELTLQAAEELALQNNLGLKIEDLSREAALYAAKGSWGAFDWTLNANTGWNDDKFKSTSIFGGSKTNTQTFGTDLVKPVTLGGTLTAHFDTINTKTDNTFSALGTSTSDVVSLSYVQPLLRGAWRQYATAQQTIADMAWRRQVEHERGARQKLLLDVDNAYWDLVAAKANREVSELSLGLGRTQLDQDQRRLDAGVGTPIDVLSAETEVASREAVLLAIDVRVRERADALRKLILPGADAARWETELLPSTPLPTEISAAAAPGWDGALETALQHRAELREQKLLIDQQKVGYTQRVSEKRPGLDLAMAAIGKGFSGDAGSAFEEAGRYDFPTYQATLTFSYPLQNRTATGAERAAWMNLRAANLAYDDLETQVAADVREAIRQVVYQAEAVRAASKSLDLSRRQLDAEDKRHDAGETNYFQLLSAQQKLAESLYAERNARANWAKALVASAAAQGLIGEDLGR
jgi:outer membrane protein TolC